MLRRIVRKFLRQRRKQGISERDMRRRDLIDQACKHGCVCVVRPLIEKGDMDAAQEKIDLCAKLIREAKSLDHRKNSSGQTEALVRLEIARNAIPFAQRALEDARAS